MINNHREFLNQFRLRRFASQSEAAGAKFRDDNSSSGFNPLQILKDSDRSTDSHKKFVTGFTLTEILIVVIIVGILATLALPMLVKTLEKAKLGEAASNLNLIRTGEKIYFLEWSTFTSDLDSLNIENPNSAAKRYFDYTIESADSSDFTARSQRQDTAPSPYKTYYYEIKKSGTITSNGPLSP